MSENKEYILGVNETELSRLKFQHEVWKEVTDGLLKNINIQKGWKCLDVGAGPGLVSAEIRDAIGEEGEITALEPSAFYLDYFKDYCEKNDIRNANFILGNLEDVDLQIEYYDLIFLRWVIDFVKEPEEFILKLLKSLKKGGVIAILDYNYEGLCLHPMGGPADSIPDLVRAYYRAGGGDPYFISKVPPLFRKNNVELIGFSPVILSGDNKSPVFDWAYRFFTGHLHVMVDLKIITESEKEGIIQDWEHHKKNPDTVFFSPVVVNVIGKKK